MEKKSKKVPNGRENHSPDAKENGYGNVCCLYVCQTFKDSPSYKPDVWAAS